MTGWLDYPEGWAVARGMVDSEENDMVTEGGRYRLPYRVDERRVLVITDRSLQFVEVMMRGMPGAMVISPHGCMTGHRFNLIIVAIGEFDPKVDWIEWYGHMLTRLDQGGVIVGMPDPQTLMDARAKVSAPEPASPHAPLWRALAVNL